MAEDRTVESLAEACSANETYSAWTRMEALLQRRYLNPNASGTESACFAFIFKALDTAAVRFLSAEVAAKLADATQRALEKYQKPLGSDYAQAVMERVLDAFEQVAVVDFQFKDDVDDSISAPSTVPPVTFAVTFSNNNNNTGNVLAESVVKLENLLPWYACLLRLCETMVRRLANADSLLLPSPHTQAVTGGYVGESAMTFNDRIRTCDYAEKIQKWTAAAARAAYRLFTCMAAKKVSEVSVPALYDSPADDGAAGTEDSHVGSPAAFRRGLTLVRVDFPAKLTLATTLVRLQQWASCPVTAIPSETKEIVQKAVNATVLGTLVAVRSASGAARKPLPEKKEQLIREQCWQAAMYVFDILCRSVADVSSVFAGSSRTDVYGSSDFFAIERKEAVRVAQIALDAFKATPLIAAAIKADEKQCEWIAFLTAWLIVMNVCVESRSWVKGSEQTDKKRDAYLRVCKALCNKCQRGALAQLPQLDWMKLAESF